MLLNMGNGRNNSNHKKYTRLHPIINEIIGNAFLWPLLPTIENLITILKAIKATSNQALYHILYEHGRI
jgi:hypothetical protein